MKDSEVIDNIVNARMKELVPLINDAVHPEFVSMFVEIIRLKLGVSVLEGMNYERSSATREKPRLEIVK